MKKIKNIIYTTTAIALPVIFGLSHSTVDEINTNINERNTMKEVFYEKLSKSISYDLSYKYKSKIFFNEYCQFKNGYVLFTNDKYYVIYNLIENEISEFVFSNNLNKKKINENLYYIPIIGIVDYKNNNFYDLNDNLVKCNQSEIIEILLKKYDYSYETISKEIEEKAGYFDELVQYDTFSTWNKIYSPSSHKKSGSNIGHLPIVPFNDFGRFKLTENYWWWYERDSKNKVCYDELDSNTGLCEYIALINLVLYYNTFYRSDLLKHSVVMNYIETDTYNKTNEKIFNGIITPKFKKDGIHNKTLTMKLYEAIKVTDIWLTSHYYSMLKYLVEPKVLDKYFTIEEMYALGWENLFRLLSISNKYEEYIADWFKNHSTPLLVGSGIFSHAFIIFGYNEKDKTCLINNMWGRRDGYSVCEVKVGDIFKKYGGYIYNIRPRNNINKKLDKIFYHEGEWIMPYKIDDSGYFIRGLDWDWGYY